jgi:hypothetical protein
LCFYSITVYSITDKTSTWESMGKGHFTLRPSVEQTRDSSNLIGREPKFVHSAFILEANSQQTRASKTSTWEHFFGVLAPKVCPLEESLDFHKYCGQVFFHWTTFLSKLIQSLQFIYFNGLLPYPLEGSLSEVL